MSYFSRLSDIVTCKLDDLLADAADPSAAIAKVVAEIEEGLNGAKRSVHSASTAEQRLQAELGERRRQVDDWAGRAREELRKGRDDAARQALSMKREAEDLLAGLEQQLAAATSTREHLATMLRAIEARLAEARRRQTEILSGATPAGTPQTAAATSAAPRIDGSRAAQIEAELEALRRELQQSP